MKKAYAKPELFCEEYELSESIAGTCGHSLNATKVTSGDAYSCGYKYGGRTVLFVTQGICNTLASNYDEETLIALYGFCYQPSGDNSVVFSS